MLCIFIYLHLSMFFILLLYLHLISRPFYDVTSTPPWFLKPVKASTSSEFYPTSFDCLFFFIYRERYGFQWAFIYPRAFFTLFSLLIFWHNLLLSRLPWELAVIPGNLQGFILILNPAHLFLWFTVFHNLLYILNLYLYMSILKKFYLWWKLWSKKKNRSAATVFSSHIFWINCSFKKYISEYKFKILNWEKNYTF